MNSLSDTLSRLVPGLWFGLLAAIAFIATPAAFAALDLASAGLVARRIFAWEAPLSLLLGALILALERRRALERHRATGASQFSVEMMLSVGALLCTVAGYYGLQPMMETARRGVSTPLTFAQLHFLSTTFFGLKGLLVLGLAWKAAR